MPSSMQCHMIESILTALNVDDCVISTHSLLVFSWVIEALVETTREGVVATDITSL